MSTEAFTPGSCIGRYVVLRSLGHGGHGEVLAAFDPVLDRNVALKLLRREGGDVEALIREARVLARASHPHIVTIHDAGVASGRAFLTMELIGGSDLAAWSRSDPRPSVLERLAVLRQVAEGLASAHALGIVHGDVKPANVLVGSGRARVTDFGVAVWIERDRMHGDDAPRTRRWYGTPAYMAPEQYDGAVPNAASDQYAFCQMAWELLYDAPAFVVRTPTLETASDPSLFGATAGIHASPSSVAELLAVAEAKQAGPPALPGNRPTRGAVPQAIGEALRRGLLPDPNARWPSMATLLEALAFDPLRRQTRRRVLLGSSVLAIAASLSTAAWVGRPSVTCEHAGDRMAETWNDARRAAVAQALTEGHGLPETGRAWVLARLDDYAHRWIDMRVDACRATHERGEQSAELLDLRMACLDGLRHELASATEVLEQAEPEISRNATRVVSSLTPAARCADANALRSDAPPSDPALAEAVAALERDSARERVLRSAGLYDQALALSEANVQRSEAIDHPRTRAEVLYGHATMLYEVGRYDESARVQEQALALALAHGHVLLAIEAASDLAFVLAVELRRIEEATAYSTVAEHMVRHERAGTSDEASVLVNASAVAQARSDDARDRELLERAAALLEADPDANPDALAAVYENLAASAMAHGDPVVAEGHAERAYELYASMLGREHPRAVLAFARIGEVLATSGRTRRAEEILRSAAALLEGSLGPDHVETRFTQLSLAILLRDTQREERALALLERIVAHDPHDEEGTDSLHATALADLGATLVSVGRADEGEPLIRRALAELEAELGAEHIHLVSAISHLGTALLEQGRLDEARPLFERALTLWGTLMGEESLWIASEHVSLAEIDRRSGLADAAVGRLEHALGILEHDLGASHHALLRPLGELASVLAELGHLDRAEAAVQRGRGIAGDPEALPRDRAELAFAEAKLRSARGDRDTARARAEEAVALYRQAGDACCKRDREAVDAWLRVQPSSPSR